MVKTPFLISHETYSQLWQLAGQKVPGRAWVEQANGSLELRFEPYQRGTRRHAETVLAESTLGRLVRTPHGIYLRLGASLNVGEASAIELVKAHADAVCTTALAFEEPSCKPLKIKILCHE